MLCALLLAVSMANPERIMRILEEVLVEMEEHTKQGRTVEDQLNSMRLWVWTDRVPYGDYNNPGGEELALGARSCCFNPAKKTLLFIHGFQGDKRGSGQTMAMDALRRRNAFNNYNHIAVDWHQLAASQGATMYDIPAGNTERAGKRAAEMLLAMLGPGVPGFDNIHVVGHSLGSHVAGNMCREIETRIGRKCKHLTLLDPAAPKFVQDTLSDIAVKKSDAEYVEAIVTNGALNRPYMARGYAANARPDEYHAAWYFNGGSVQPGCDSAFMDSITSVVGLDQQCNHPRSTVYYAEAMLNPGAFRGFRCTMEAGIFGWIGWSDHGCLDSVISDRSQSALLTEDYGGNKPQGTFLVETNSVDGPGWGAVGAFSKPSWNNQG